MVYRLSSNFCPNVGHVMWLPPTHIFQRIYCWLPHMTFKR